MTISVQIVSIGARTPLGLHAVSSVAAYRAGISAMGDHPFLIDLAGNPMPSALDGRLDPNLMGPSRILALAETALHEACVLLGSVPTTHLRLPVYLGLPELRPGFTEKDAEAIRSGISLIEGLPIEISEVNVFTEGHSAGLLALEIATERIRQGALEACVVGGVDSYFQSETMEWLEESQQLDTDSARSAFVPGEGAGFCLLMSEHSSKQLGLSVLTTVIAAASGRETKLIKTSDTCIGAELTTVVKRSVGGLILPSETINTVICDINGERYRSEEWGFVCLRLSKYFDNPASYWSPADSWGDMGAASGILFVILTCQATIRGFSNGPKTLLWTSSEGGLRSSVVLASEYTNNETRRH